MGEHAHKEITICPSYNPASVFTKTGLHVALKLVPKLVSVEPVSCKIYTPCKYGHLFFT